MIKVILFTIVIFIISIFLLSYVYYKIDKNKRIKAHESNSFLILTEAGQIEYKIYGDTGPIILISHGSPGGYDQGNEIFGYRVLVPSRPGFLRTPISVGESPIEQAHAFNMLLVSLEIDSVFVMGNSGGAPAAINFASLYPERTKGIILLSGVSDSINLIDRLEKTPSFLQSDYMLWLLIKTLGVKRMVKLFIPDANNQELILQNQLNREMFEKSLWTAWPPNQRLVGQVNDAEYISRLDLSEISLNLPALIIHGTADSNVPFDQSEALSKKIENAHLFSIEGGDHFIFSSHKEIVDQKIRIFLSENTD